MACDPGSYHARPANARILYTHDRQRRAVGVRCPDGYTRPVRRPTRAECPLILLMVLACAPAVVPVALAISDAALTQGAWSDIPMSGARWVLIARSLWISGLIALLATLLAIPMAQVLRRSGARLAALLLAPLWLPAWLTYAGLNLARAPDTILGGAILDAALPDHRWAIVLLGRAVAIGSLVLWSVPIAALVMAASDDPDASAAEELIRTERMLWIRRAWMRLRLHRAALLTGFGAVFLLTVGSSLPLHLAQIETDAIVLWRAISERTPDRWAGVWLGAWPELVIAGLGAAWFVRRMTNRPRPGEGVTPTAPPTIGRVTRIGAWLVWASAAVLPITLMAWSLDARSSPAHWLKLNAEALVSSAMIAAGGGLIAGLAAVLIASAGASERSLTRRFAYLMAWGCLFGMLVPGVLVGAAIAGLGPDLGGAPVIASSARTLFIAGIAGLIVAGVESPDARAMRSMDARGDALGWLAVHPARGGRLFAGVWVGAFLLGIHEIEASTLVRPPGSANLPQQMLSDLHYARLEQLSAGGVVMGTVGIALGIGASWLLSIRLGQPRADRAVTPPI